MHHSRAYREHVSTKRKNRGRCLIQLQLTKKTITLRLREYLDTTTDWILLIVNSQVKQKKNLQFVKEAKKCPHQFGLTPKEMDIKDEEVDAAKKLINR